MSRLRPALGLAAGVVLLASAAMHSLLGWPGMRGQLVAAGAPADLVAGVRIGWLFGGAMILAFGVLACWAFAERLRGAAPSMRALRVLGAAYAAFGVYALATGGWNPFFLIFVVPGALVLAAADGP
ncbi:hypothetical protein [Roseisolibacter sp. H3M3-2]|uniref:hypothetical protein n=1 Tax=Roseisolibacter sp. H3M3-2 TaxID=3031323 RepID=UPI0023DBA16E|nr:hypothetical protein [Roseisolibacter sp. H3M3-2]MDF1501642.1 hypothetical protein [Roseisolibacter sp. H3M3-2]